MLTTSPEQITDDERGLALDGFAAGSSSLSFDQSCFSVRGSRAAARFSPAKKMIRPFERANACASIVVGSSWLQRTLPVASSYAAMCFLPKTSFRVDDPLRT